MFNPGSASGIDEFVFLYEEDYNAIVTLTKGFCDVRPTRTIYEILQRFISTIFGLSEAATYRLAYII